MSPPGKPKFYTDEHVPSIVVKQLRRRDVDIVRCQEVGLRKADDAEHLAYAVEHGYILVSRDEDFTMHHSQWMAEGKSHYGIVYITPKHWESIGLIVNELLLIHEAATAEEMINVLWYI